MVIRKKEIQITDPDEWNTLVDDLDKYESDYTFRRLPTQLEITTKKAIIRFSLTGKEILRINVPAISKKFHNRCDYDIIKDRFGRREIEIDSDNGKKTKIKWDLPILAGYTYTDEDFADEDLICWSYDVHSAFSYAMLRPMPDTTVEPRMHDYVKSGEIGFLNNGNVINNINDYADYIFPLKPSPFSEYIAEHYKLKNDAPHGSEERQKWKYYLNIPTGLMARENVFIRNAIIFYSNQYIRSFIDEDTVYVNIDSIVSLRPRYDLPLGDKIGQFEEEHSGERFKYIKGGIYQWNNDCFYRGVCTQGITDIDNIEGWQFKLKYNNEGVHVYEQKKD